MSGSVEADIKISRRLALKNYRVSKNNRASQKRYADSAKGRESNKRKSIKYALANREKRNAKHAVAYAVRRGRLPKASNMPCFQCLGDAAHYHHPSYERGDRLKVVPLCQSCHSQLHYEDQERALDNLGLLRGWIRQPVASFERIPDRFGRAGYKGMTILRLGCGHRKSIGGSAVIPKTALCALCAEGSMSEAGL